MYKQASKSKLRIYTDFGNITTEDLWDLSLEQLDTLAKGLYRIIKKDEEISFISTESKKDSLNELTLEIMKDIIKDKLEEKENNRIKIFNAERKRVILNILASKENETLQSKSKEDLIKELEAL